MSDIFSFDHNGPRFTWAIESDDAYGPPWENSDGHGPVRCVPRNAASGKRAGERWLSGDRHSGGFLYDWQAAMQIALRDGWGPNRTPAGLQTRRTLAAAAVQSDFDYLRA